MDDRTAAITQHGVDHERKLKKRLTARLRRYERNKKRGLDAFIARLVFDERENSHG